MAIFLLSLFVLASAYVKLGKWNLLVIYKTVVAQLYSAYNKKKYCLAYDDFFADINDDKYVQEV